MTEQERLQKNKEIVLAFYDIVINQKDYELARPYMTDTYIQHNPTAESGPEGLRDWLVGFKQNAPNLRVDTKRVIAEGDCVMLHSHGSDGTPENSSAVMDVFRLEGDKIAEHWDVIQQIPAEDLSGNGMF